MCSRRMGSKFVPQIDLCGDDALSVAIDDSSQRHSIGEHLRDTGTWLECVILYTVCYPNFSHAAGDVDEALTAIGEALTAVRDQGLLK